MTIPDRISRLATLVALALALAAPPARADGPETPPPTAEQLAEEAYQQHASGRDAEAIATYLRAYELSKAGALLYNIAAIYDRKLGERGLAEDYFRRYLVAADAQPELVRKATERLTALKKEDQDEAAAKSAPIAVAPVPGTAPTPLTSQLEPPPAAATGPSPGAAITPAHSSGHTLRVAGVAVGALGLVGVGASMVLGLMAKAKDNDANAVCNGPACSNENGVALANQAGSLATASTISIVAGATLVGGGVTMYLLAPRDVASSRGARVTVSPQIGMSRAGLTIGGTF